MTSDTDERPKKPYILLCTVGGKEQEIIVDRWMRQDDQILLGMGIGGSIDVIT